MERHYKVKLNIKSKATLRTFRELAGAYRSFYNMGVDLQTYQVVMFGGLHPTEMFLSKEVLTRVMQAHKDSQPYLKEVDERIFREANNHSFRAYRRTTGKYLSTTEYITDKKLRAPMYLSRKKGDIKFRTTSIKVFYDYVEIPGVGKAKLFEKGYIPQGKIYHDILVSFDGNDWWLSLSVYEPVQQQECTGAPVNIHFNRIGRLTINGKLQQDVTSLESFQKLSKKRKKLDKKLRRQASKNIIRKASDAFSPEEYHIVTRSEVKTSRNMVKTRKAIARTNKKLDNVKKDFFKKIVHNVARTKPNSIYVPSLQTLKREKSALLSRGMREKGCIILYNMFKHLEKKGFKVVTRDG